jgi:uncharacterized protein YegP (UPF0339 family)
VDGREFNNKESLFMSKFEIFKDRRGEYRFRLKAPNGRIIAVSEGYKYRKNVLRGINSVRVNCQEAEIVAVD